MAVVVPKINTKLDTSKLGPIVKAFKEANMELADSFLNHKDGTIDLLLGTDYLHVLPTQSCVIGNEGSKSIFLYCCQGIMPVGDLHILFKNLQNIHLIQDFVQKFRKAF